MAEDDRPDQDRGRELSLEEAAQLLDGPVAYVNELLDVGAIPYHEVDGVRRIRAADLADHQAERARRRVHLEAIARIVDESAGGWDHP